MSLCAHPRLALFFALPYNVERAVNRQIDSRRIRTVKDRYARAFLFAVVTGLTMTASAAEPPCTESVFRQFDFWIGSWEVSMPDGTVIGHNRISAIANGCGLLEEWIGIDGGSGKSLIAYQPEYGHWRQFWVSSDGGHTDRIGGPGLGGMVLSDAAENTTRGRNVLTIISADELRQQEQASTDAGLNWATVFEGIYRRRSSDR